MENWQAKTDQELVSLALDKADNFLYIMKRYENPLGAYARRISGFSSEEIEDILQEVFIKVYRNLNDYNPKFKFSSWIYRITHNEVISRFRKMKARPAQVSWDADENLMNKLAEELETENNFDLSLMKKDLKIVLNKLDEKYREVLILRFLEEKDYREISDILKKPSGTIATLISRAKKQLQGKLSNR